MTITYISKGSFGSGTSAVTAGVPSGYQSGDLFLLFVNSANQAIATPSGWTKIGETGRGTGGSVGSVSLAMFYKVVSGTQSNQSVADSGSYTTAIILCYRGVDTSNPINVYSTLTDNTARTAIVCPSVTTTTDGCMIVCGIGLDRDANNTANMSAHTNSNLTNVSERHDQTVSSGAGGGIGIIDGQQATKGVTGTTSATGSTSTTHAYITVALEPYIESITYKDGSAALLGAGNLTASGLRQKIAMGSFSGTGNLAASGFIPMPVSTGVIMAFDLNFDLKIAQEIIEGSSNVGLSPDGHLYVNEFIETDTNYYIGSNKIYIRTLEEKCIL